MKKISFLGLGAMGQRMVSRIAETHEGKLEINAWNRSPRDFNSLIDPSIKTYTDLDAAIRGSNVIFSMIRDDDASQAIWHSNRLSSLPEGAAIVECSTLSPEWVETLREACHSHSLHFSHCPVIGSRPHAEKGLLTVLAGGSPDSIEAIEPLLTAFSNNIIRAGSAKNAAKVKLAVNSFFAAQNVALAELLSSLPAECIQDDRLRERLMELPLFSAAAQLTVDEMIKQNFSPLFPIELVVKDLEYQCENNADKDIEHPLLKIVLEVFKQRLESGCGADNINGVVQHYARE